MRIVLCFANAQTDQEAVAAIDPKASSALNAVLDSADRQGVYNLSAGVAVGRSQAIAFARSGDHRNLQRRARAFAEFWRIAPAAGSTRFSGWIRWRDCMRRWRRIANALHGRLISRPASARATASGMRYKLRLAHPELIARTKPGYFAR